VWRNRRQELLLVDVGKRPPPRLPPTSGRWACGGAALVSWIGSSCARTS